MEKGKIRVKSIISMIFIIALIIVTLIIYNKYNYNDFTKNISEKNKTTFTRDSKVKYSKMDSYKIENTDYHDAMFSQVVKVIPFTPYKVTCKVKVENVENKDTSKNGGAHICIDGTTERSEVINGTSDWQDLVFYFNSKNREKVNIGFRLGGFRNEERVKGTAWFSDFKMEAGVTSQNTNWNMICFIFPTIDVNVNVNGKNEHVNLQMSDSDISKIKANFERFETSIREVSNNKMSVNLKTVTIYEPIKTLSYDAESGYYVSSSDVIDYIDSYLKEDVYDHIYVAFRMADKQKGSDILVNDWIGLGGMDYAGIGFSNIRMPDDENNLAYEYDNLINIFPEEVFIHEFLHTLERNAEEYGYNVPALHDYEKYGYKEDRLQGLRLWYSDYMNKKINYNGEQIGLPKEIYAYKPVSEKNFVYSTKVDALQEPSNIIEHIRSLVKRIGKVFEMVGQTSN